MRWQGIVIIVLIAMDLVEAAILDGTPKTGKHDFIVTLITKVILVVLLYTGGFFS